MLIKQAEKGSNVFACIPPLVPQEEAVPLALACSGSVCGCHGIGRSQWRCSSVGAKPIPDWAPAQRERTHLIQHDAQGKAQLVLQEPASILST